MSLAQTVAPPDANDIMWIRRANARRQQGPGSAAPSSDRPAVWFSGIVERIDPVRREISIITERGVRLLRSRMPFSGSVIRVGDAVTVSFVEKHALRVTRS